MTEQVNLPRYRYAGARSMVILHERHRPAPRAVGIEAAVDEFLEYLVARWRAPLARVPEDRFERPEFESRWKTKYGIDAMLEHAVMHPLRHEFQLTHLLAVAGSR